jgi:hypothetical protein
VADVQIGKVRSFMAAGDRAYMDGQNAAVLLAQRAAAAIKQRGDQTATATRNAHRAGAQIRLSRDGFQYSHQSGAFDPHQPRNMVGLFAALWHRDRLRDRIDLAQCRSARIRSHIRLCNVNPKTGKVLGSDNE